MKKTSSEYMEQTEEYVLHTYNRFPVVMEKDIWISQQELQYLLLDIKMKTIIRH